MDTPEKPTPSSPSGTPPGGWISPKLREKLMDSQETEWQPKSPSPWPWVIAAIVLVVGGVIGFMTMRSGAEKKRIADEAARAKATADSLVAVARAESLAAVADTTRADSAAMTTPGAPARPPASTPTATASRPSTPSTATPAQSAPATAAPSSAYGVAIGQFLFEDRANSEKDRIATATGLQGIVRPVTEGGTTVYRVIIGSFDSRSAAQGKADELTAAGTVNEARVVPVPK
jgi:cell division septation protein DedD